MVERYEFTCPDCDPDAIAVNHGRYVRHSDYARLQEQLEVVTRESDHWIAENRRNLQAGQDAAYKLEAAEAERDRLREAAILLLSEIDAGNDAEHINGATGPLRAALQKEPQP